jgi:hypothetical protein
MRCAAESGSARRCSTRMCCMHGHQQQLCAAARVRAHADGNVRSRVPPVDTAQGPHAVSCMSNCGAREGCGAASHKSAAGDAQSGSLPAVWWNTEGSRSSGVRNGAGRLAANGATRAPWQPLATEDSAGKEGAFGGSAPTMGLSNGRRSAIACMHVCACARAEALSKEHAVGAAGGVEAASAALQGAREWGTPPRETPGSGFAAAVAISNPFCMISATRRLNQPWTMPWVYNLVLTHRCALHHL